MGGVSASDLPGDQSGDFTGEFVRHLGIEFDRGDRRPGRGLVGGRAQAPPALRHRARWRALLGASRRWPASAPPRGSATKGQVVGVNNNTDFYRAVRDGPMTSTATPIHRGRRQQVWVVETVDADGRMVARGQVRLQNLYPQD